MFVAEKQVAVMNIQAVHPAPDLPPRRAFNVEEIRRLIEIGVISEEERFELIEGEIVVMSPASVGRDDLQNILNLALAKAVPEGLYVGNGSTLQLAEDVLVLPDLAVISSGIYKHGDRQRFARPTAQDVLLVIEIAASSLAYDRKVKARLYASHGIREYWVIDAAELRTWIHTAPSGDSWSSIVERGPDDVLTTAAVPGFAIKLSDIAY
jgi:Uma2 family endonuclease